MFRLFFIIIFLFCYRTWCAAQPNLVPNPGFDIYTNCPYGDGQVAFAEPWIDPTNASSDYFNTCSINGMNPNNSWAGIQYPLSGEGYMGLFAFINTGSVAREYIQVELIQSLISGIEYCVSFYVSLGDSSDYAVNNLGCLLTNNPITDPTDPPFLIHIPPQVLNNGNINPLVSKEGWIKIEGSFIALGGEKFLTIGNFFNDSESDTVFIGGSNFSSGYLASYYYVDDISVKVCNYVPPIIKVPNIFSPNNDGINDTFFITTENVSKYRLDIYNRWGANLKSLTEQESVWDGTHDGQPVSEGVYFFTITYYDLLGEVFSIYGTIQLIR